MKKVLIIIFLLISFTGFSQEKVNNGTFINGTSWTTGTGWSIGGGVASYDNTGAGALIQASGDMVTPIEPLHSYTLQFDLVTLGTLAPISFMSTDYKVYIVNTNYYAHSGYSQHYSFQITTPADIGAGGFIIYSPADYDYTIDNISLVENAAIGDSPYYVSTIGTDYGAGTIGDPWLTPQRAFTVAQAGDIVYFRGGVYYAKECYSINAYAGIGNNGTASDYINFFNYPGEVPIIDYSQYQHTGTAVRGIAINYTTYVHFKGLTIRNVWQRHEGITVSGVECYGCSNIIFENCTIHDIGGRAFGFFGGFGAYDPVLHPEIPNVATDTVRYINCDMYNLCDSLCTSLDPEYCASYVPGGISDGIKWNNTLGSYLEIRGCRAWHFGDNGYDPNGNARILIDSCYAFDGGWHSFEGYQGEGSGFKYGNQLTDDINVLLREVNHCVSTYNHGAGFDENNSRVGFYSLNERIYNNISYNNDNTGFLNISYLEDGVPSQEYFRNNISYNDVLPIGSYDLPKIIHSHNSFDIDITITDSDFESVDTTGLTAARQADGSLPDNDAFNKFLHLSATSDLINAGTAVIDADSTLTGFFGSAPDLGAFEYAEAEGIAPLISTGAVSSIKSILAIGGGNVTSDGGATVTDRGVCWGTSTNPTISGSHSHTTGTTGLFSITITGLASNTTYHLRSFATNSEGTSYGSDIEFTTAVYSPATSGGKVIYENGKIVIIQ